MKTSWRFSAGWAAGLPLALGAALLLASPHAGQAAAPTAQVPGGAGTAPAPTPLPPVFIVSPNGPISVIIPAPGPPPGAPPAPVGAPSGSWFETQSGPFAANDSPPPLR